MSDDKKKQAMSLLFGDAPPRPTTPSSPAATSGGGGDEAPEHHEASSEKSKGQKGGGDRRLARSAPTKEDSAVQEDAELSQETPDPYYKGSSRYRRKAGDLVKHSVYLDPAVSRAVKMAAALGDDPRGSNISAIVNTALRELGYE